MTKRGLVFGALVLLTVEARAASPHGITFGNFLPKVIYGEDNRKDVFEAQNPHFRQLSESTAALFSNSQVKQDANGNYLLKTDQFGSSWGLCSDEPFYQQPIGAFCSGSLVGPDLMMTAGHCIRSQASCDDTSFVFNFSVRAAGEFPSSAESNDVYRCKKLVNRIEEGEGADFALVQLDRPVLGHNPLVVNREGDINVGSSIVVIGHPSGLPTKIADGAKVRDNSQKGYFTTDLDTYGGNSGSAVFNATTGLIEGILVRGENDFTYRGGCAISNRCTQDSCRGEDVTKISVLAQLIPAF